MRLALLLLAVATATAHAQAPSADPLARARELAARLEYDGALAIVDAEIRAGRADRARLAELYLLAGTLAAGLDRAAAAEHHFAIALALQPTTTLPAGTSPKLTGPFDAARARSVPLAARVEVHVARGDGAHELVVVPSADPLGLVTGIGVRLRAPDGAERRDLVPTRTRAALPPDAEVLEVFALDRHGNTLASAPPPHELRQPRASLGEPPATLRAWHARPTTWIVIGAVSLAVAGIAGYQFHATQDEFDDRRPTATYGELRDLERRGERWGWTANIALGVGAVSAVVAIVAATRGAPEPAPAGGTASRSVTVTSGPGAGLGLAGSF